MTRKRKKTEQATSASTSRRGASASEQRSSVRTSARTNSGRGGEETEGSSRSRKRVAKKRRRWPYIVVLVLFALVVAVAGLFSWDRWMRYDDSLEFVGEWQVKGTSTVIVIDKESVKLTEDVVYGYTLDTGAKTLELTFGNKGGHGRYRFSPDRTRLFIVEGPDYSGTSTLFEDIGWTAQNLVRALQGEPPLEYADGEGVTSLVRVSHDGAAVPRTDPSLVAPAPAPAPSATPDDQGKDAAKDEAPQSTPDDTKSADPGVPATPGEIFDVNDVAA
ncbi:MULTISPECIES: hypothetical protein [Gordonibacter]|uniref:Uncharacterized protein n=1 Tax=Gordonibacter faecis TaxID=3047475 RepID=A0ABT7DPN4_9ACTN|nr:MULTISPECIES: hypothetical protein [unclassified Gordonibacter]MDJ1651507.1 hypothetical protein [Gordonibacter sp. KGMB12511]HIW77510.1 hypothetical protein [Candidatus Gordonibacter avicola]